MDASAANKFILLFILTVSSSSGIMSTTTVKQVIKSKYQEDKHHYSSSQIKVGHDSTTTTPVFNPVTTTTTTTPSIVTVPSANNNPTNPIYNPAVAAPGTAANPAGQQVVPIYPPPGAVSGQSWCVAKGGITEASLQAALDYACGIGGADCSAIQIGASCYNPNTLENHASFAFNSYYQRYPVQTSCDFGGTAVITNLNPSSGSCIYSMSSPSIMGPPTPTATVYAPITTNPTPTTTVSPPVPTNPTTTPTPTTTVPPPITTNPTNTATPTTTTTVPPPITTNPTNTPTPTTLVPPITTNPTPTPTTDSGTIPISFGTPPMVSTGSNPALGGGTMGGYGDGSSFPGNNSSSSISISSHLERFTGSVIVVVIGAIVYYV